MKIKNILNGYTKEYFIKFYFLLTIFTALIIIYLLSPYIESQLFKNSSYKFDTIESLEKYTNYYKESFEIENKDWQDPSFISLYKKNLKHSSIKKICVKLGFIKTPLFNITDFQNLLEKVTKYALDKKLTSPYNKIIEAKNGEKYIVFGDIHSAIHSFVRDLVELKKQNIIDENLKIIHKNTKLVFLGDAIDRAPFSLETLNILLILMEKNPEKMIYLRGNHETNGYWQNFNMRRQIQTIFPKLANKNDKNNLLNRIDKFFATLPDALILNIKNPKNDQESKIICSNEEKKKLFENKKDVKFMILGEKRFDVLKETPGLEFIGYSSGTAKWSTISCPSTTYQKFFNFYFDAFTELLIGESAEKSIISLINRDARKKDSKFNKTSYDPIFARKIKNNTPFKPKNIYSIGSTMSLSGINAPFSNENRNGVETSILVNNEKSKNLIKPVILDDGYSPRVAKLNVNKLINTYSLNTVLAPTGTPTLSFYIDMLKSEKIYVFFPITGASVFRDKNLKNIIHFRTSYKEEIKATINYLVKEHGIKSFAFFYQNDSYGKPIAEVAHEELKKLGIKKWLDFPHLRTQSDFQEIVYKIKADMPEAIGCFSTNSPTQELVNELGSDFFSGRTLFGVSFLFSDSFQSFLKERGIKHLLVGVVPDPKKIDLEIVKEFDFNMNKRGLKINSNSLEGYISGSLIAEAINNISEPFTEKKIMNFFENMKDYNFKGLKLTFDPEKRDLSQPVFIRTFDNNWINYKY